MATAIARIRRVVLINDLQQLSRPKKRVTNVYLHSTRVNV